MEILEDMRRRNESYTESSRLAYETLQKETSIKIKNLEESNSGILELTTCS